MQPYRQTSCSKSVLGPLLRPPSPRLHACLCASGRPPGVSRGRPTSRGPQRHSYPPQSRACCIALHCIATHAYPETAARCSDAPPVLGSAHGVTQSKHAMHAATHSTVAFPIDAFRRRIERLAAECRGQVLAALPTAATAADIAAAVRQFLRDRRFAVPDYGRSALPPDSVVDHGVGPSSRDRVSHMPCKSVPPPPPPC